ncbi:uncharacterized protein METZ01_LOCUS386072, partial [marine metagenome]
MAQDLEIFHPTPSTFARHPLPWDGDSKGMLGRDKS